MNIEPVSLSGHHVRLEPMCLEDAEGMRHAAADPAVWRWLTYPRPETIEDFRRMITLALEARDLGAEFPFTIHDLRRRCVIGSTRYLSIRRAHRGLEIGWTWLGSPWQRTGANTECKLLLLRHAFTDLGALRVEFKTDINNTRSQAAIERLGAVREGIFRHHMVRPDGTLRDSVYYSIIQPEWPAVERRLEAALRRHAAAEPTAG